MALFDWHGELARDGHKVILSGQTQCHSFKDNLLKLNSLLSKFLFQPHLSI